MHIELLWLIPVIAVALFVFFLSLYFQSRTASGGGTTDIFKEVELFNAGQSLPKLVTAKSADERLKEMEKTINFVAETFLKEKLSTPESRRESAAPAAALADETKELREKLRTVFREYDIVLSENYTLRAKIKQLVKRLHELDPSGSGTAPAGGADSPVMDHILTGSVASPKKTKLHLYDDTRFFNIINQDTDDLSETDDSVAR